MKRVLGLLISFTVLMAQAQKPYQPSSAEIFQKMKKLDVLGNVLYLAAHPDDENTRFIAYCANEKLYNTAYLSMTRGDGGQNLVGPEIREQLGIIRTQELLAARRVDGGQQFFTRANDFGYSKTSEETEEIWDREKVLGDIVWVIRKFRPDVIVLRFPPGRGGHGHHSASATLGVEAFDLAADKNAYPEQLKWVKVWQAKRIVVNTGRWWSPNISAESDSVVAEDIGVYNPALGISYNEMAAISRTMHKSQGFGSTGRRGEHLEYFEHVKGQIAKESLFDGIDASWNRVKSIDQMTLFVQGLVSKYDVKDPSKSVEGLVKLRKILMRSTEEPWVVIKLRETEELIRDCLGLYVEAVASDYSATPGDSIDVAFEVVNRSTVKAKLKRIYCPSLNVDVEMDSILENNDKSEFNRSYRISSELKFRQPYWLEREGTLGTYNVDDQLLIGTPENTPDIVFEFLFEVGGMEQAIEVPLVHKRNDPVKGEQYRPFMITPPVFVNISEPIYVFANKKQKELEIIVKSGRKSVSGRLNISVPKGWEILDTKHTFNLKEKGEEQSIKFRLKANEGAENGTINVSASLGSNVYRQSLVTIEYDHIPTQTYFPHALSQLINVKLEKRGERVGYIHGAGDVVPEALVNMGYSVDVLEEGDVTMDNLKNYHTVVLGIRALNTNERIGFMIPALLEYVKAGGTMVIQYNTRHRLKTDDFSPYPIKLSRDRVTEEDSEVKFLLPDHPIFTTPNKISQADFDGWVQERGLYFPGEWDEKYSALLSWHDKGEDAKTGALLAAEYGNGHFVYTGISFFRELPAGVPGAYRLLANIISFGNE